MTTMTTTQAAATLGVSIRTIQRRAKAGKLTARKNARGRWVITMEDTMPAHQPQRIGDLITATIDIDGTTWTISGSTIPNPLNPEPSSWATVEGRKVWINCQYRQFVPDSHIGGCAYGTRLGADCTCAPVPADPDRIYAVAREVLTRVADAQNAARRAAELARLRDEPADLLVRLPAGCDGCPSAVHGGVCTCC